MWAEVTCAPPTSRAPRSRGRLSTAVGRTTPVPSSEASALRRGRPWRTCLAVTTEIRWYRQTSGACMSQMLPFFTNGKSVATLCGQVSPSHSVSCICSLCVCVTFWYFLQYFKLLHYSCVFYDICDQLSLMLLLQKDYESLNAQRMVSNFSERRYFE